MCGQISKQTRLRRLSIHSTQWADEESRTIPSHFVQFLILFQLFLLTLQCAQSIVDVLQQLLDLFSFSLWHTASTGPCSATYVCWKHGTTCILPTCTVLRPHATAVLPQKNQSVSPTREANSSKQVAYCCGTYFASAAVAVDSSHMTASSSASWCRFSPPSNFVNGHMSTMQFMVCHWPQQQEGDWARPHLCKLAWHRPWPVWKRFIRDHLWRGRSKPGCRIVAAAAGKWDRETDGNSTTL